MTLNELWWDLLADALASDGPISDADVKNAVARARPRIEAAVRRQTIQELQAGYMGDKSHWFTEWLRQLLDEVPA